MHLLNYSHFLLCQSCRPMVFLSDRFVIGQETALTILDVGDQECQDMRQEGTSSEVSSLDETYYKATCCCVHT